MIVIVYMYTIISMVILIDFNVLLCLCNKCDTISGPYRHLPKLEVDKLMVTEVVPSIILLSDGSVSNCAQHCSELDTCKLFSVDDNKCKLLGHNCTTPDMTGQEVVFIPFVSMHSCYAIDMLR